MQIYLVIMQEWYEDEMEAEQMTAYQNKEDAEQFIKDFKTYKEQRKLPKAHRAPYNPDLERYNDIQIKTVELK